MGKTKRIGKIELFRFIFAVIILLHHSHNLNDGKFFFIARGSLGVEFFFLVGGYFLAKKCAEQALPENLGRDTWEFILKKYKNLLPILWISQVVALVINIIVKPLTGVGDFAYRAFGTVFEGLLLNFAGYAPYAVNGVTWYLSAMMIAMLLLYPLCRKHYSLFSRCIAPLCGVLLIGMLNLAYGSQTGPDTVVLQCIRKGVIRAIAEICLGVVVFELSRFIQKKTVNLSTAGTVLISVVEAGLWFSILYLLYKVKATKYDAMILYLLVAVLTLAFSQRGYFSRFFDNKFCYALGSLSLPIYLGHPNGYKIVNSYFPTLPLKEKTIMYVGALLLHFTSKLWTVLFSNKEGSK